MLDLLRAGGIPARIFNANASSLAGELPVDVARPQLWVDRDNDAARARELIEGYVTAAPQGPSRACPRCGEDNPPAFELCWHCGAGLPP